MMGFIFLCLMIFVFTKIGKLAVKATWGLTKIAFSIVLFPIILIVMALSGFIYLAIGILVVAAIGVLLF